MAVGFGVISMKSQRINFLGHLVPGTWGVLLVNVPVDCHLRRTATRKQGFEFVSDSYFTSSTIGCVECGTWYAWSTTAHSICRWPVRSSSEAIQICFVGGVRVCNTGSWRSLQSGLLRPQACHALTRRRVWDPSPTIHSTPSCS